RLIGLFGGVDMPAIGVAFGVDRIMLAMEEQGVNPPKPERKRVLVVAVDENNVADALKIAVALRRHGVQAEIDVMRRGLSRALSDADRRRIAYAIIVGPKELGEGKVILRDMRNKVQEEIRIEDLPGKLSVF
ncbi:MAG: His/Gly/Thr/Pro-type tRNA ligase C-terminal domain-containing protein, partial [Candidatus Bathyarchaeia archaeon]